MAKEAMVYQANPLIEGRREFSLIEMRLFYIGLRDLVPKLTNKDSPWASKATMTEFPATFVPTVELIKMFGNRKYYSILEDVCKKMAKKTIEIKRKRKKLPTGKEHESSFSIYPVFSELSYEPGDGLKIEFNAKMKPWLLDLANSAFTKLPFEQVWALSSAYAVRLFELLLQYQNTHTHERTLTIEELRRCLGMSEDAYEGRMNNFRQRVIDSPVKDINAKTNYKIEYEPVKEGRRIVAFKFKLHLPEEVKKKKRRERLDFIMNITNSLPSMPTEDQPRKTAVIVDKPKKEEPPPQRSLPTNVKDKWEALKANIGKAMPK